MCGSVVSQLGAWESSDIYDHLMNRCEHGYMGEESNKQIEYFISVAPNIKAMDWWHQNHLKENFNYGYLDHTFGNSFLFRRPGYFE